MKKTTVLCVLALLLGCFAGLLINVEALRGRGLTGSNPPPASPGDGAAVPISPMDPAKALFDAADNGPLLEAGDAVLEALKQEDAAALAALTDPDRGVTFTPYSTVDFHSDLTFLPEQLAQANGTQYVWGFVQGKGEPITLTLPKYLERYVFNVDYTQSPIIGVDRVLSSGNALENVSDAYPGARFLEYYFPEVDPANNGFDWCALKLVFQAREGVYKLVGIIHSEWTV